MLRSPSKSIPLRHLCSSSGLTSAECTTLNSLYISQSLNSFKVSVCVPYVTRHVQCLISSFFWGGGGGGFVPAIFRVKSLWVQTAW
jgi:hypothetical protein